MQSPLPTEITILLLQAKLAEPPQLQPQPPPPASPPPTPATTPSPPPLMSRPAARPRPQPQSQRRLTPWGPYWIHIKIGNGYMQQHELLASTHTHTQTHTKQQQRWLLSADKWNPTDMPYLFMLKCDACERLSASRFPISDPVSNRNVMNN